MDQTEHLRLVVAKVVSSRRRNSKLSQQELADSSGLARSYISHLERGKRIPSIDVIFRLASAFGVKPETLVKNIRAEQGNTCGNDKKSPL